MKSKKCLLIFFVATLFFSLSACGESENTSDPNRTSEKCSYLGTASVYGTAHQMNASCTPDGDGWYNPAFGHHHHK